MRVAIGADHAGVGLKGAIAELLHALGIEYQDFGTSSSQSVDYPDFAVRVARGVVTGAFDRGILVCGTGIGMAIAANKFAGIRAAAVTDLESARLGREHNDLNVLTLGGRILEPQRALEIVRVFLDTPFAGGRHAARLRKISALERDAAPLPPTASCASPDPSGDRPGHP